MIRDPFDEYFWWMYRLVIPKKMHRDQEMSKVLRYLHSRTFTFMIPMDENRAEDGKELRYKFARYSDIPVDVIDATFGDNPCSVLEMMVALAYRCENQIMENDIYGDRTSYWFWKMLNSLGLDILTNDVFTIMYAKNVVDDLLDRAYSPDGKGGLFYIPRFRDDMRKMEIWYQMHAYLETVDE